MGVAGGVVGNEHGVAGYDGQEDCFADGVEVLHLDQGAIDVKGEGVVSFCFRGVGNGSVPHFSGGWREGYF